MTKLDPYAAWVNARGGFSKTSKYDVLITLQPNIRIDDFSNIPQFATDFELHPLCFEANQLNKDNDFLKGGFITALVTGAFLDSLAKKPDDFEPFFKSVMVESDPDKPLLERDANSSNLSALNYTNKTVIMGVIDDAIPFAQPRLRLNPTETRFLALWVQDNGTAVGKAEFNKILIATNGNEQGVYKSLGQYDKSLSMVKRSSHGAHVTDLLSGYEIGNGAGANRPLIGVQLLRRANEDFSGLSLSPSVVNALFFILIEAKRAMQRKKIPIVVNLSYALFSGSRKHSHPLGQALDWIAREYNKLNAENPLTLVLAAGNHYQSRMHAILPVSKEKKAVQWRILPDDRTSSFVECWLGETLRADFSLTLTSPKGERKSVSLAHPTVEIKGENGQAIGLLKLLQDSALGEGYCVHLALAPSFSLDAQELTPHGLWEISLNGVSPQTQAHLWILRDDSPYGAPQRGRQSHFEDADYVLFENGRISERDTPDSAIKREGSLNAIYTQIADDSPIVLCGGAYESDQTPAIYASAGDGKTVRSPDVACVSDQSRVKQGVFAAGIRGGSFTLMNGTSVAAPLLARAIADDMVKDSKQNPVSRTKKQANPPDKRLGNGVVAPQLEPKLAKLWRLRQGFTQ